MQMHKPRLVCTVTIKMGQIYDLTRESLYRYAAHQGADFFELTETTRPTPHYAKYDLLTAAYTCGYQRVLFVDADVYIRENAPDIFNDYRNAAFNEFPLMKKKYQDRTTGYIRDNHDKGFPHGTYYNTGVMVFNRGGLKKLIPLLRLSKEKRGVFWEQDELNYFFWKGKVLDASLTRHWNQFIWRQGSEPKELDEAHFLHASGIKDTKRRVRRINDIKARFP